jgi:hypothetical protein
MEGVALKKMGGVVESEDDALNANVPHIYAHVFIQ